MELQHLGRHRVHVHLDVRVGHVDPHHLRIGAGDGLDRDAVVLLLVDQLEAERNAA